MKLSRLIVTITATPYIVGLALLMGTYYFWSLPHVEKSEFTIAEGKASRTHAKIEYLLNNMAKQAAELARLIQQAGNQSYSPQTKLADMELVVAPDGRIIHKRGEVSMLEAKLKNITGQRPATGVTQLSTGKPNGIPQYVFATVYNCGTAGIVLANPISASFAESVEIIPKFQMDSLLAGIADQFPSHVDPFVRMQGASFLEYFLLQSLEGEPVFLKISSPRTLRNDVLREFGISTIIMIAVISLVSATVYYLLRIKLNRPIKALISEIRGQSVNSVKYHGEFRELAESFESSIDKNRIFQEEIERKNGELLRANKQLQTYSEGLQILVANLVAKKSEEIEALSNAYILQLEHEREEMAFNLHDMACSEFATLKLLTQRFVLRQCKTGEGRNEAEQVLNLQEYFYETLRSLAHGFQPPVNEVGIINAIRMYAESYAKRTGIEVRIAAENINSHLSYERELVAFLTIAEGLTNVHKHSSAKGVVIKLFETGNYAFGVMIEDNGRGFDPEEVKYGMGIRIMRERAEAAGGSLRISSRAGEGTIIMLSLPLMKKIEDAA